MLPLRTLAVLAACAHSLFAVPKGPVPAGRELAHICRRMACRRTQSIPCAADATGKLRRMRRCRRSRPRRFGRGEQQPGAAEDGGGGEAGAEGLCSLCHQPLEV
eukprot:7100883-Prymnesium_polylepis.1